jgi:LysM repeat protein
MNTTKRIIAALLLGVTTALGTGIATAAVTGADLSEAAPDRYIVLPGDTLWSIAGKFLKDPGRWPELWRLNKDELRKPQKLSPGDIIVLRRQDENGQPRLQLARPVRLAPQQYSEQNSAIIPSIPAQLIQPFLSEPLVVEPEGLVDAARIVGTPEGRVLLGRGDTAFVSNATTDSELWQIYRPGKVLRDPDHPDKEVLGVEALYLGTARKLSASEPALFELVSVKQEIGRGDRLLPAPQPAMPSYVPHRPEQPVSSKIISIYGGVDVGGKHTVVAINKGKSDKLEIGHVLTLYAAARTTTTRNEKNEKEKVTLPEERSGLAFVFRTFDRVSYALVMEATRPINLFDSARNQ